APGDGGFSNDPNANAQNLNSLLGKMLRIDIDTMSPPLNYSIPPTNPFAGATFGADEIYAYGLRNPYRFSFDRGGTNTLWVADVGQGAVEEVDNIVSGGNYGWRVYEGTQCTNNDPQLCSGGATPISSIPPVFQYTRVLDTSGQNRCSVTGGYVYRGKQNALPVGSYVYGDYCTGEIMLWNGSQQTILRDTSNFNLVAFGEDEDGELYFVRNSGSIGRIVGVRTNADFDGDGGSDLSVYRPDIGMWFWYSPLTGAGLSKEFGISTDIPVAEDYDGDGKTDIAVFRPEIGYWFVIRSSDFTVQMEEWGTVGDIPSPGDFTGDRRANLTVYRPSSGLWWVLKDDDSYDVVQWGAAEDHPVNSDFDGDGRNDIAVWRPSTGTWWLINSSNGARSFHQWGQIGDIPTQADFDGDGRTDEAIYRPSSGEWYIVYSSNASAVRFEWGIAEDIPVPGDYDRDGRDDIAVWRPSSRDWWITRSSDHINYFLNYGLSEDLPIAAGDAP
ncbi:MAG TPA: PQQ-dependent sugar dehydrogenase, partial [Pyrinomonadaceae bacterium]|nr:PQQ-dependent sugar dehydrogenase [Pyrinomonadaceae bacterium]